MRFKNPVGIYIILALLLMMVAGVTASCRSGPEEAAEEATAREAPASEGEGQEASESPLALAGTSWVVESLGEGDAQVPALDNVQSTLGFLADRYGGNGGCNFYVGVYTVDGAELLLETPARTGAACADAPESLTQDNVFMSALATVASYSVAGDKLELYSSNGQLMLTLTPMEPAPLMGTTWSLEFVNVETQWQETLADTETTMRIDGNELSGSAGCNTYSATVSEEAGALTISELTFTEMACPQPAGVMEQETLYLSLLEQAALVRQFPVSLELLDVEGAPLLLFGATDEPAE